MFLGIFLRQALDAVSTNLSMKIFEQLATILLTLKAKGKANWSFQFF